MAQSLRKIAQTVIAAIRKGQLTPGVCDKPQILALVVGCLLAAAGSGQAQEKITLQRITGLEGQLLVIIN